MVVNKTDPTNVESKYERRAFLSAEELFGELISDVEMQRILENAKMTKEEFGRKINAQFFL